MHSKPISQRGRRAGALATAAVLAATGVSLTTFAPADSAAAAENTLAVDFSESTGDFQGGASGMLYGLSDDGVPTDPIVSGAAPRNITQKAPHGEQHPNGDPLDVDDQFFRNGGEYLMTNIQDYYPDWPYNGGKRPADFDSYLEIVRTVVTSVVEESEYADKYVFVPFNEPDGGNWYNNWGALKDTFLADWKAAFETIRDVYPEAAIAGPGDSSWHADRTRDFLTYARDNNVLPEIFTWHELGIDNLRTFRGHLAEYRQIEKDLGIEEIPVNITEYAMRRDMSVPGQLVQWLAMFEDEKVDAQTAYWTYAGNLNDNMAKNNSANGAWWLLKWYGDMTGETVSITPPELNKVDSLQGIATLDTDKKEATVVFGGGSDTVRLGLDGLDPAVFGDTVDVQVREAEWTGQEGEAQAPRVVAAERVNLGAAGIDISVPNDDRLSAYQVVVTPAGDDEPVVDSRWRTTIEAEDTTLANVTAFTQTMSDAWTFAASGQRDVGSTNKVNSSLTWTVDVPESGTYRFGAIAGVNGPQNGAGKHALFVDGELASTIDYEAGFSWTYRGRGETLIDLTAGTHELSVRMSTDGATLLPGSDISLDKFDLEYVAGPESTHYPAALSRTDGTLNYGSAAPAARAAGTANGSVHLTGSQTADFYVSVREDGYYDLATAFQSPGAASLDLSINGRAIPGLTADAAGTWSSTARVHLAAGISRVTVGASGGIDLHSVTTTRAADADEATQRIELEDGAAVTLNGAARVEQVAQPTNVSGAQVGWLGDGAANTAVIARPAGMPAGQYNVEVRYANAEKNTGHDYNTDVVSRFLDISEAGGETARGAFRHNYSWKGFWTHTVPLDLATSGGALTLGNASGAAPNIDWIAFAPLVVSAETVAVEDPTVPVDPTDPTTPVDPADPVETAAPVVPEDSATPAVPVDAEPAGSSPSGSLSDTGFTGGLLAGLGALLLAAGSALFLIRRRRAATGR